MKIELNFFHLFASFQNKLSITENALKWTGKKAEIAREILRYYLGFYRIFSPLNSYLVVPFPFSIPRLDIDILPE